MTRLHIYTAPSQPATRYRVDIGDGGKPFLMGHPAGRRIYTDCCHKPRIAKNLVVQVYYDCTKYWCKKGKGCEA